MRSNAAAIAGGSGAAYSMNSKPSVPIGLSGAAVAMRPPVRCLNLLRSDKGQCDPFPEALIPAHLVPGNQPIVDSLHAGDALDPVMRLRRGSRLLDDADHRHDAVRDFDL